MHIFLVFSFFLCTFAPLNEENCCCSSVVEHFLGKEEVTSSSLVNSSGKEEPWLFLFCILTQAITLLRSHPCSNKKRQHSRTATHPPGALNVLSSRNIQSSPIGFISIHHHAPGFRERPYRAKTASERITSGFSLHYIFLWTILVSD